MKQTALRFENIGVKISSNLDVSGKFLVLLSPCFSRLNRLNSNVPLQISTKNDENFPLRYLIVQDI